MKEVITALFESLKIGDSSRYDNLELIPLYNDQKPPFEYLLAQEALDKNLLELTEATSGGRVSRMRAINHSDSRILFITGEEFRGAKQNRIVNSTIMIEGRAQVILPVSCVEEGRWNYQSDKFKSGTHSYPALKKSLTSSCTQSLFLSHSLDSDQALIWKEVERKQKNSQTRSHTKAMSDVYESSKGGTSRFIAALPPFGDALGIAVFVGGELQCIDLFDRPSTLCKVWNRLIESYALDALEKLGQRKDQEENIEKYKGDTTTQAQALFTRAYSSELSEFDSPGVGKDLRWKAPLVGSALICDGVVVHLNLFPEG